MFCEASYDGFNPDGQTPSAADSDAPDTVQDDPGADVPDDIYMINSLADLSQFIGTRYLLEAISKPDSQIDYTNLRNLFNHHSAVELIDEDIEVQVPIFQFNYSISPDYETPASILDERAVAEYKQRLIKITEHIAERQSLQDDAFIDDLIEERDFIMDELSRAFNRYGRLRTFVTQSYRDRQSVTKAIREVIRRLRKLDSNAARVCDRHLIMKTYVSWSSEPLEN